MYSKRASTPHKMALASALAPWAHGLMARAHGPTYRQGVIPDFTLPDTLEKNFVRDLASKSTKLAETL